MNNIDDVIGQKIIKLYVGDKRSIEYIWETLRVSCSDISRFLHKSKVVVGKGRSAERRSIQIKFWNRINKTKDCWNWTGGCQHNGYGSVYHDGRIKRTHRLSYELHYGNIPRGINVCHKCDNPSCVRPDHLFLGTQKDNVTDMINKGRAPSWFYPKLKMRPIV